MENSDISIEEYLQDPCKVASIPYWKQKLLSIPANIKIVHESEYSLSKFLNYCDEQYFRMLHDLKNIELPRDDSVEIIMATSDMIDIFVDIINSSYTDIKVSKEMLNNLRLTPVFN